MKLQFNILFYSCILLLGFIPAFAQHGSLEKRDFQFVLYLKGTPYEMGYDHGSLLKEAVKKNISQFVDGQILANREHPQIKPLLDNLPQTLKFIPQEYIDEMKGLAIGAEVPYEKVLLLNLLPEMFHCTAITVSDDATENGELYHVRVLDYSAGKNLQNSAVLMVVSPEGKIPFVNVCYAGFIGTVTAMNLKKIAVGEVGGKGYGQYEGMPMAFLLRSIMETAFSLDDVVNILNTTPRTCEYYYVFSDGKIKNSIGFYATPNQLQTITPGSQYALFTPTTQQGDDKIFFDASTIESSPYQNLFYSDKSKQKLIGLLHKQPPNSLVLTGFANPKRYPVVIERLLEHYGHINVAVLQSIIKKPVTCQTNLHNAIFAPATLEMWISHASIDGTSASEQPYEHFDLKELIKE